MTEAASTTVFTLEAFRGTRAALREKIVTTPLLFSDSLSAMTDAQVHLKAESFQRTHSFKLRGAYGTLLPRIEEARAKGVVAGSSGNFAQGLAYACRELEVPARVVMLERSAPNKVEAARRLGAEIEFCANDFSERIATVERIHRETGRLLIHSYDDAGTIRGNGTAGLELIEQLPDLDVVLAPTSGGGLLAGVSATVRQLRPEAKVYGVQPEANPSMKVSLEKGEPTTIQPEFSIADGLIANRPGRLNFGLIQEYVEDVLLVTDREIRQAVVHLLEHEKLVIEPSGAAAVAALLRHLRGKVEGKNVVVMLSGGNLDQARLARIVDEVQQETAES